jgi:hypothetical protein
VVFNSLQPKDWQRLRQHHEEMYSFQHTKHGQDFRQCDTGKMTAAGFRVAQGGHAGNGYAAYPSSEVDVNNKVSSIQSLFARADVCFDLSLPQVHF